MSAKEEKNQGQQGGGANTKNPQTAENKAKKAEHDRKSKYAKGSKN